jgi:hypothetical protein
MSCDESCKRPVSTKYITVIKDMYDNAVSSVQTNDETLMTFQLI